MTTKTSKAQQAYESTQVALAAAKEAEHQAQQGYAAAQENNHGAFVSERLAVLEARIAVLDAEHEAAVAAQEYARELDVVDGLDRKSLACAIGEAFQVLQESEVRSEPEARAAMTSELRRIAALHARIADERRNAGKPAPLSLGFPPLGIEYSQAGIEAAMTALASLPTIPDPSRDIARLQPEASSLREAIAREEKERRAADARRSVREVIEDELRGVATKVKDAADQLRDALRANVGPGL
jgi:hypothetical protein